MFDSTMSVYLTGQTQIIFISKVVDDFRTKKNSWLYFESSIQIDAFDVTQDTSDALLRNILRTRKLDVDCLNEFIFNYEGTPATLCCLKGIRCASMGLRSATE